MFVPERYPLRLVPPLVCALACFLPSPLTRAQQPAATQFQFTKIDLALLDNANAMDSDYEQKGVVFHDPGVQAYIDAVGKRVIGDRPTPEHVTWRFMVLNDPATNAFAEPNGSVYVTMGLIALLQNQAQLAAVLGHETSHVIERHTYLENRSARKKAVLGDILAAAAAVAPGGAGLAVAGASIAGQLILVESIYGYSREMEQQADSDGTAALAAAGYDPRAMAATFELLDGDSTLEYEPRPTFYHDHPRLKEREAAAVAWVDAHPASHGEKGLEHDYLAAFAPVIAFGVQIDIQNRRPRTAVARARRLVDAFPSEPAYRMLLGQAYRELGAETAEPTADELTEEGEDRQRKQVLKLTEEQEQQKLASTPPGRAALAQNQAAAEKLFLAVIHDQPDYALVYRELGFLYEDESRFADAATGYQRYLQLVDNTSLDRLRIQRRLAECQTRQSEGSKPQ
jgi:predicted Zn-dependent protease